MKGRASSRWQARKCLKLSGVDVVYSYRDWATCGSGGPPFNMKNKIAIWIEGGAIQGARSNVDIELEIIDLDIETTDKDSAEVKWKEYQTELPFEVA